MDQEGEELEVLSSALFSGNSLTHSVFLSYAFASSSKDASPTPGPLLLVRRIAMPTFRFCFASRGTGRRRNWPRSLPSSQFLPLHCSCCHPVAVAGQSAEQRVAGTTGHPHAPASSSCIPRPASPPRLPRARPSHCTCPALPCACRIHHLPVVVECIALRARTHSSALVLTCLLCPDLPPNTHPPSPPIQPAPTFEKLPPKQHQSLARPYRLPPSAFPDLAIPIEFTAPHACPKEHSHRELA